MRCEPGGLGPPVALGADPDQTPLNGSIAAGAEEPTSGRSHEALPNSDQGAPGPVNREPGPDPFFTTSFSVAVITSPDYLLADHEPHGPAAGCTLFMDG